MKKIKLLSLFLAVLMLAGMATLFSSCANKEGEITPSNKTVDIDLSGYTVLYGDSQSGANFSGAIRAQFDAVASALSKATGANFRLTQASRSEADADAKEILLGATNRKESQKALSGIKGDGFVIKVTGNKIVIVGTSNLYTVMAMDYFVTNYLTGKEKSKTVTVNETVKANNLPSIVLADSTAGTGDIENAYTYVYKDGLGMTPNAYLDANYDVTKASCEEYPMTAAQLFVEKMAGVVKLSQKFFPIGTDATVNNKEVLIGMTGREESQKALSEISETQSIVAVKGDRVVVTAWSNIALATAVADYQELIKEATVKDKDGNVKVVLPKDFRLISNVDNNWVTNFPKPEAEGINLYNTMDNNDDSLQYLYKGTGVNKAAFDAYCKQLEAAGYKATQTTTVDDSDTVFKFYTNKSKNIALYVAYNSYEFKDTFSEFDYTVVKTVDKKVLDPYGFENTIRIISSTIENAYLPEDALLKTTLNYTPVTQTKITSVPIYSKAVGVCIIITLEDGRFIVLDGGGQNDGGSREQDTIWNTLCALNEQVTEMPTSKQNPVRIAAWVLSHAHWDHYAAFNAMLQNHGKSGEMTMNYMIANIPSHEAYNSEDFSEVDEVMSPEKIKSLQSSVSGGFKLIKPHMGMTFNIGNVKFDTMVTWEELNPIMPPNTNDTNTTFRLTISSVNSDDKTTMMWLGDANRLQSRVMCATFGTSLKADICTTAHHGNAGCEIDLYEMIDPETIFWTHNTAAVERYLNPESVDSGWQYQVDQYFSYDLESVKRIFAAGEQKFFANANDETNQAANIASGREPSDRSFIQLQFVNGVVDYDHVMEGKFVFEKDKTNGVWKTVSHEWVEIDHHTDISGGREAFIKNVASMDFISNYMVKCDKACPTGEHTH